MSGLIDRDQSDTPGFVTDEQLNEWLRIWAAMRREQADHIGYYRQQPFYLEPQGWRESRPVRLEMDVRNAHHLAHIILGLRRSDPQLFAVLVSFCDASPGAQRGAGLQELYARGHKKREIYRQVSQAKTLLKGIFYGRFALADESGFDREITE